MTSQSGPNHQQQLKQYLRKHKTKWKEETLKTSAEVNTGTASGMSGTSSRKVSSRQTEPKQRVMRTPASSFRQLPVRRGRTTVDHLPDELLLKIFAFFGAHELLLAARVCKRWNSLASDNLLWMKIFKASVGPGKATAAPIPNDLPLSYWKSQCIKRCSAERNKEALRKLRSIHLFTGLPKDTVKVLQKCVPKWILVFRDSSGKEHEFISRAVFSFSMSNLIRWYSLESPPLKTVRQIQVFSQNPLFFEDGKAVPNSPYQKSLVLVVEVRWENWVKTNAPATSDGMVDLYILPLGIMVATWKADGELAFVSVCLHHHQLVQRCLQGSPDHVFVPAVSKPRTDDVDRTYGLHDYSCTVELHHQRLSIWSQQFRSLHCKRENLVGGYVVLDLIRSGHSSDHVIISEKFVLPWKTDTFKGKLENVTLLDVTLLDERRKPFWCISSPVRLQTAGHGFSFDYSVERSYLINYMDSKGKAKIEMSWSPERQQHFVTSLQLAVSIQAVNDWFSTSYT